MQIKSIVESSHMGAFCLFAILLICIEVPPVNVVVAGVFVPYTSETAWYKQNVCQAGGFLELALTKTQKYNVIVDMHSPLGYKFSANISCTSLPQPILMYKSFFYVPN